MRHTNQIMLNSDPCRDEQGDRGEENGLLPGGWRVGAQNRACQRHWRRSWWCVFPFSLLSDEFGAKHTWLSHSMDWKDI